MYEFFHGTLCYIFRRHVPWTWTVLDNETLRLFILIIITKSGKRYDYDFATEN